MEKKRDGMPRLESRTPTACFDRRSGFDAASRTFHSLRPPLSLPPLDRPLSFASYAAALLPSPLPSNPAVVDSANGDALSFLGLLSQARFLAAALRSTAGLAKGDVALILAPARLDIPVLYLALLSIGVVISAANPISTLPEINRIIALSKPSIAFATSRTATKIPSHFPLILLDSHIFQSFLDGEGGDSVAEEEVNQSDVAVIQFSSGTTGMPKAAALSHRNFIVMVARFHAIREPTSGLRQPAEVTLLGAPLFHSMGFFFLLKGVALGETTVVMSGRGGVQEILRAAEGYRVTAITAAPPVVVAMARLPERLDLEALKHVICGGAPLPEAATMTFMERFPKVELRQGYGSTEAGGVSIMISYEESRRVRSAGRLYQDVEAKVVDYDTGELLSVGQTGELYLRGSSVMIGYVGDDKANANTFDLNGWLKTGDLCYFDQDGFLYIVDRLKELIKYKGYQVPPAELEHLLHRLAGVADVAVVPYPHEEAGQIPVAFIVKQAGATISEAQVMDFIAEQVAPYKKIRKVVFTNSIPKTPSGKILRSELLKYALLGSVSKL